MLTLACQWSKRTLNTANNQERAVTAAESVAMTSETADRLNKESNQ